MQSETEDELTLFERAILTEQEFLELDSIERLPQESLTIEQGTRWGNLWAKLMRAGLTDPSKRRSAIERMLRSKSFR